MSRYITNPKKAGPGRNKERLTVIILTSFPKYRLKAQGPPCLFPVNTKQNIIDAQLYTISQSFTNYEVVVVTGYQSDRVINYLGTATRIVENQTFDKLNFLEEIKLAINNCDKRSALFIKGDVIFDKNSLESVTSNGSCVVVNNDDSLDEEVGIIIDDNIVSTFAYGLDNKWSGIVYLSGYEFDSLLKVANMKNKSKLYFFEALNLVIENGGKFNVINNPNSNVKKVM